MIRTGTAPRICIGFIALLLLTMISGCAAPGYVHVKPTPLDQAQLQVPEENLLDVGVAVTVVPELTEKELEKQGTNEDIRRCESHYIPFHMKNTLQRSGYWGAVQVIPSEADNVDLKITSELMKSNGEVMQLKVRAVDARGKVWMERGYYAKVDDPDYAITVEGEQEVYQNLYNTVANDVSAYLLSLTPNEIREIRTVSKLKFAQDFAPEAYDGYLADANGLTVVQRLPADGDPLMNRIERIRERDYMFLDTLNQYYEGLYDQMWGAYENWRKFNHAEQTALREVKHQAFMQTMTGILMIAAAIALEAGDVPNTEAVGDVLILGGGMVMVEGINVSQQAQIHAEAISELSESFRAEMHPTIVEFEGKQYELTGTANEQYERWEELLQKIYYEETGFGPQDTVIKVGEGETTPGMVPTGG